MHRSRRSIRTGTAWAGRSRIPTAIASCYSTRHGRRRFWLAAGIFSALVDIDRARAFMQSPFMTSMLRRWSPIPLRLIVGCGFIVHGSAKIMNGPDHFAASLHALGVPAPGLMTWATIVFELAGGFAVLV